MLKIILILLVLFGAALYAPQTRPYMVETLAPVVNPVLGWQTTGEMGRIVRELQTRLEQGSSLPAPGDAFKLAPGEAQELLSRATTILAQQVLPETVELRLPRQESAGFEIT